MMRAVWRRLVLPMALLGIAAGTVQAGVAGEVDPDHPAYRGSPGAAAGSCCATLREVRGNIDRIDREILALMAERGSFVHEAARFKPDPASVDDPHRVEQIIAKIRDLATQDQLSPDVAEATYRAMIAGFTAEERRLVEQQSAPVQPR
jgi:isochorismate pyruvate lyase